SGFDEYSQGSKWNRRSLHGLERIPNDGGDLLREIVGHAQVFSKEAYLALDVTIHERLPGVIRYLDPQDDRGRSGNGDHFALFLAAFLKKVRSGSQRDQVGCAGGILILAAINVLELSGLADLRYQVFVDGYTEFRGHSHVTQLHWLDLNGRGRELLRTLGIARARLP